MGTVDTTVSSSSRDSHMTLGWDNPTADPTTTILLRHGDTQLSPEHRFSGLRDLPLSANGTRQAPPAACPPVPRSMPWSARHCSARSPPPPLRPANWV